MCKRNLEALMTDDMRARREICPMWDKGVLKFGKCRPPEWFQPRVGNPDRLAPEDVKKSLLKRQNPARIWEMLKLNPWVLECVLEPTEDMCLAAVRQDGLALVHVEVQTEGICRAAVKQDPYAIALCFDQTEELCLMAVRNNGLVLHYIEDESKSRRVCLEAVRQNGMALEWVPDKFKDAEMCHAAVPQFPVAIIYCPEREKTPELLALSDGTEGWIARMPTAKPQKTSPPSSPR